MVRIIDGFRRNWNSSIYMFNRRKADRQILGVAIQNDGPQVTLLKRRVNHHAEVHHMYFAGVQISYLRPEPRLF